VNGVPTSYTLDLESGLTQVLADGTSAYLYPSFSLGAGGNGRLAEEQPGGWSYHLPDALGSVRQLTDAAGGVTLAHAFEPYGESLASSGAGDSAYGYTGEWTDGTGLVHLRARYYAPYLKHFTSRDDWEGDPQSPNSYVAWMYAYANPVNLTDPSGRYPWWCEYSPDSDECCTNYLTNLGRFTTVVGDNPVPDPSPSDCSSGRLAASMGRGMCPGSACRDLGAFDMSGYYFPREEDWRGKQRPIRAHPEYFYRYFPQSTPLGYLKETGPGSYEYTTGESIQTAKEGFLYSNESVCMQGTGRLRNGKYISCGTSVTWQGVAPRNVQSDIRFWWNIDVSKHRPFVTVAVCKGTIDHTSGIRIFIPELMQLLESYDPGNPGWLEVNDTGGRLCHPPINGIDLFTGTGEAEAYPAVLAAIAIKTVHAYTK
jgi:RHS repeat-associated protein